MFHKTTRNVGRRLDGMALSMRALLNRNSDPDENGPYKIFVVGCGRSGTHWLGHILESYPEIHVTIEARPMFSWVSKMARKPNLERRLFPLLVQRYRQEHRTVLPRHYADKSHPNLFLAEKLRDALPEARFIGIARRLEGTIASMMLHPAFRRRLDKWNAAPRTARYIGVSTDLIDDYKYMSPAARFALWVIAQTKELERLQAVLGERLHVIKYESLANSPRDEIARLNRFLGLEAPANTPEPKSEALSKWRSQLTERDLADIRHTAGRFDALHLLDTT